MFSRSLRLGRVRGVDVRLSPTLPLFAAFVLWAFAARFAEGHGLRLALAMGVGGMLLFFASILAHELGHALEARHRDLDVVGITLSMFGGVTEMHAEDQTARDELAVAAIGPYISLLCAAACGLVATFVPDLAPATVALPIAEVAGLVGWINVVLAVFNLVPGAPLDGGRVLRAALWWLLKDRRRAVVVAGRCGQVLWVGVMVVAVWGYLRSPDFRLTGVLLGLVGLFLFDAARREIASSHLDALYSGRTVADLVGPLPPTVDVDQPLDLLTLPAPDGAAGSQLAVVVDGGDATGLLDLSEVEALHPADRSVRSASELSRPFDGLPTVDVDDDLHTLIDRFQGEATVVVLRRDGRPIGAVTQREAAQAIRRLRGRDGAPDEDRPARTRTAAGS